jgi:NTE family protein
MPKWAPIFILICFSCQVSQGQENIENLVFEGAGIRGIAYAGVTEALEENHVMDNLKRVGGTSAGAITSLLVSLGYEPSEIVEIVSEMKFERLNDGRYFFIGGLLRTKKQFGWYRDDELINWIGQLIEDKTGNSEITFSELKKEGYLDLYVTATSLTKQKLVILSHESYPEMRVKDAVRISMSIPLYFEAVFVDENGQTYEEQNEDASLDVLVDGGITGNFPIQIFDSTYVNVEGIEKRIANEKTLGVRMDTDEQIEQDKKNQELAEMKIESFEDYTTAFYTYILENLNRKDLTAEDWERTISVSSVGISPRVQKLTNEQKNDLIESGRSSVHQFFTEK